MREVVGHMQKDTEELKHGIFKVVKSMETTVQNECTCSRSALGWVIIEK